MDKYSIAPPYCGTISCISNKQKNYTGKIRNIELRVLNCKYVLENSDIPNIVFNLKHETVDLLFLKEVFENINKKDLMRYIKSNISGMYAKKIYFLYEYLSCKKLDFKKEMKGPYIDILDEDKYFTSNKEKIKKYKINDNFLGNPDFNPLVRKTDRIRDLHKKDFSKRLRDIMAGTGKEILKRAADFLYSMETKSSYRIENEIPPQNKVEVFVELLKYSKQLNILDKENIIALQNEIVLSAEKQDKDYYTEKQNYVGSYRKGKPVIHFIAARPEDKQGLMNGLFNADARMKESGLNPFVRAAVISYGLVFIHPFSDGNGRLHRFVIHSILKSSGIIPDDIIVPISANMLNNRLEYDSSLENISKPLMKRIQYTLSEEEEIKVKGETKSYYSLIDYTDIVEYLFFTFEKTITEEFEEEILYLSSYDRAFKKIDREYELSPKKIDILINIIKQNDNKFPKRRVKQFPELNEKSRERMETIIENCFKSKKF